MKGFALPSVAAEWLWFGQRQFLACLFGFLLLAGMIPTRSWDPSLGLTRPDFLFLYALALQVALVAFRLEHADEVAVILVFHLLATLMEWFKTSPGIGSWSYPAEGAIFRVYQVPLFAGFLYSAVGSYIARAWRLFEFRFERYPPVWATAVVAVLAYLNFYTHHYVPDLRVPLMGASLLLFGPCWVNFRTGHRHRRMPLLLGLFLVTLFIWIAENAGTYTRAWIYPDQLEQWKPVALAKLGSWFLLMMLSFVLVSLVAFRRERRTQRNLSTIRS